MIAERLTDSGEQWEPEMVALDLAWWEDLAHHPTKPVTRPGRAELMKRWNVSEKVARRLLSEFGLGPAGGQRRARRGPAKGQPETEETTVPRQEGPGEGQARASEGPAKVPTRVDTCLLSPVSEDIADERGSPAYYIEARDLWHEYKGRKSPLVPSKGGGKMIRVIAHDFGVPAVRLVLDWLKGCKVPKSRALFLTETGADEIPTIFARANFEQYHSKAQAWDDAGRPTTKQTTPTDQASLLASMECS